MTSHRTFSINKKKEVSVKLKVYAPTQDYDDENIEEFYEQIQLAVSCTKSSYIICIMGDLNAKVGNVTDFNTIGIYGLGKKMKEVKDL